MLYNYKKAYGEVEILAYWSVVAMINEKRVSEGKFVTKIGWAIYDWLKTTG